MDIQPVYGVPALRVDDTYIIADLHIGVEVPQSNSHYNDYESVANYFATTNCCWGYPYRVYRVYEPGGNTLAPYTNSLILNKTVYVPLGTNSTYNNQALAVYQEAMPGYEIVGVNNTGYSGWENTDALHCRTRGVMDFNMLFVDHREVIFGEQAWQDSIPVVSKFIAYSGQPLKQDSLLVYYSIDGGAYQVAHMTATGQPDEYVGYIKGYQGESSIDYYVFGADQSGHRYTQPVFADLDPHHFTMEAHEPPQPGELIITPDTLWYAWVIEDKSFVIRNETSHEVTVSNITDEDVFIQILGSSNQPIQEELPFVLQPNQNKRIIVRLDPIIPPAKLRDNIVSRVNIVSTEGNAEVTLMIDGNLINYGLIVVPYMVELDTYQTSAPFSLINGETARSITINSIEEEETTYLEITTEQPLPYTLQNYGDYLGGTINFNAGRKSRDFGAETYVIYHTSIGDFRSYVAIDDDLLSVTELSAEAKLYPNPTTGQFTVEGANVEKVEVYNLVGQKVHEAEGKVINIDATSWDKGIYLVNIKEQNGAVATKKLVVK